MSEEGKNVITYSKCQTRMVKQPELAVMAKYKRDPVGSISFSLSDDIPARVYVCPKCSLIELYYERA